MTEEVTDAIKAFSRVAEYWLADPTRTIEAQTGMSSNLLGLWSNTLRRLSGEEGALCSDRPARQEIYLARLARQSRSSISCARPICIADALGERHGRRRRNSTRRADKAAFYLRQVSGALSPSNFLLTNPELLRTTWTAEAAKISCAA